MDNDGSATHLSGEESSSQDLKKLLSTIEGGEATSSQAGLSVGYKINSEFLVYRTSKGYQISNQFICSVRAP